MIVFSIPPYQDKHIETSFFIFLLINIYYTYVYKVLSYDSPLLSWNLPYIIFFVFTFDSWVERMEKGRGRESTLLRENMTLKSLKIFFFIKTMLLSKVNSQDFFSEPLDAAAPRQIPLVCQLLVLLSV